MARPSEGALSSIQPPKVLNAGSTRTALASFLTPSKASLMTTSICRMTRTTSAMPVSKTNREGLRAVREEAQSGARFKIGCGSAAGRAVLEIQRTLWTQEDAPGYAILESGRAAR